jgi:hypothetical protein
LEKADCEHVQAATRPGFFFSAEDIKNPSAEASTLGGKFYSDVWMKGGREMADEAIRKNEKESHDAREEAKRAEEATERARRIGTFTEFSFGVCFCLRINNLLFTTAELSPPSEPYNPEADPAMKEALETIRITNEAVDEAVNRLLNEAAEKILKED